MAVTGAAIAAKQVGGSRFKRAGEYLKAHWKELLALLLAAIPAAYLILSANGRKQAQTILTLPPDNAAATAADPNTTIHSPNPNVPPGKGKPRPGGTAGDGGVNQSPPGNPPPDRGTSQSPLAKLAGYVGSLGFTNTTPSGPAIAPAAGRDGQPAPAYSIDGFNPTKVEPPASSSLQAAVLPLRKRVF